MITEQEALQLPYYADNPKISQTGLFVRKYIELTVDCYGVIPVRIVVRVVIHK